MRKERGITLIALIITIIILLILAGVTISALADNNLFGKAKEAKEIQIKVEMKEKLILALSELQLSKKGEATLEDITQQWCKHMLQDYETTITEETNGKKIIMQKSGVTGTYILNNKLQIINLNGDITEIPEDDGELIISEDVQSLFEVGKYNFNLEELLSNESIMEICLMNENVRDYIIGNDKIYYLANENSEIQKILSSNSDMYSQMISDDKWISVIAQNLSQFITNLSASYINGDYDIKYAFDEEWTDNNKVWSTYPTGGIGHYAICEFSTQIILSELQIKPGSINSEYVKGFTIYGSNDGENFEKIFEGEHGNNNNFETFNIYSSTPYKYLKLEINSRYNSNVSFQEILYKGKIYNGNSEEDDDIYIGNAYNVVNKILNLTEYELSLENVLKNAEIMNVLMDNVDVRNYIINNNNIYQLVEQDNDILEQLITNEDMFEMIINNDKWKTILVIKNLTSLITDINASYTYSSYYVDYAFDGEWTNNNKVWSTYATGGIGHYVVCEFKRKICLKELEIKPGSINSEYVKGFTIYGSNDGETFEKIFEGEHENNNNFETYTINNTNLYKYLKLEISSRHNSNVSFQEIIYKGI